MDTSETTTPEWHDLYSPDELAAALDLQAAKLAKRHGYYEIANELNAAAECIRDLNERYLEAVSAADRLTTELACLAAAGLGLADLGDVSRQIKSGIESLGKLP